MLCYTCFLVLLCSVIVVFHCFAYLIVLLRLYLRQRQRSIRDRPCVGLRGYFPRLESGRYPALQVGAVGILLEHIQKILRLRILVIALVHLSVAHTCVDGKRFGRFLRDKVDYRTGGTRAVQRTAGSFYNLDTVDGVQVETLVVEIPGHVARHALAVHQEQHVAGVEPLPVSYTHLTLATNYSVEISVVAVSLKKKKE